MSMGYHTTHLIRCIQSKPSQPLTKNIDKYIGSNLVYEKGAFWISEKNDSIYNTTGGETKSLNYANLFLRNNHSYEQRFRNNNVNCSSHWRNESQLKCLKQKTS